MTAPPSITIRRLAGDDDYAQCVRLQRETWGEDFEECVTRIMLKIVAEETGGVLAGAFDGEHMVGLVFGVTGVVDRRPMHWSHMLAVAPAYRRAGLGRRLKLFQREHLLRAGIEIVFWTFDPLEAGNAHLNLNRLGAVAERYVENYYGAESTSILHSGLGTDRLVVRWDLAADRVERILDHGGTVDPSSVRNARLVNSTLDAEGRLTPSEAIVATESPIRIEVPSDIRALKAESPETASAWRTSTRAAFQQYLESGYRLEAFYRDPDELRCFYVLRSESPTPRS